MEFAPFVSKTVQPGQKYGKLLIISTHCVKGTYKYYALCQCDCGSNQKYVRIDLIRRGTTEGCGCIQKERTTKHGCWSHPIFTVWSSMMRRCYNPKDKRYYDWGGRGIIVCDEWHNPQNFIRDMYPTYKEGLQIDRINNNEGYSLDNCRWATRGTQARNKSSNVLLTHNGKTLCLVEWSTITNITYGTLWDRIKVQGWSTERALTTPALSADERCRIARNMRDSAK